MRIVLAFLLLSGVALAAPPVAKIVGPATGKPGDLIVLDAKDSVGTHRTWRAWIDIAGPGEQKPEMLERWAEALRGAGWTVSSPAATDSQQWLEVDGGAKLVLPSYPGTYRAALAVANSEGVDLALWTVVVTGNTAPPPPPGDDPPPPDDDPPPPPDDDPPPPPAAEFFKQVDVERWLESVPAAKRAQAAALAAALRGAGDQAVNGDFDSVKKAEAAGSAAIKKLVVGGKLDYAGWSDFGEKMSAAVDGLKAVGKISTAEDYGRALLELDAALRQAAKLNAAEMRAFLNRIKEGSVE